MTNSPLRRWFQFTLGTWFVVVAILAWGLATRPYIVSITRTTELLPGSVVRTYPDPFPMNPPFSSAPMSLHLQHGGTVRRTETVINPALRWPALVLAGFVGWKVARRAWAYRRRGRGSHPLTDAPR